MSNLWAALLAADNGAYPVVVGGHTTMVDCLNERRFDRLVGHGSFGLVAQHEGQSTSAGVVWTTLTSGRAIRNVKDFFLPPTVVYTRGSKGLALWAVKPTRKAWLANDALARLFKGRIKDSDPLTFRADIRGHRAEWRFDCLYDVDELLVRV